MKTTNKRVAVVIPAYNEQATITNVLHDLKAALATQPFEAEIIVVEDGSTDRTGVLAHKGGAQVITHILNSGSGAATATGLSYCERQGFDLAATMDADGQHDVQDVIRGIKHMLQADNTTDLLLGSRLMSGGGMSAVKKIGNWGLSIITYLLFGVNVTDSQSGLRIFSQKALRALKWRTSGYEFCSEMLWRAKQQHLHITEYPIQAIYTEYSKGKGQNNWNGVKIVTSLLRQRIVELLGE